MKHWQQYNDTERLQLLDITAARTGLPRLAVEKDWWVTMVLKALSMTQYSSLMSFKGGTSLSKGWQLIERFSEDIDIAMKREGRFAIAGTSNSQLAKARRTARHYIVRELPDELKAALSSMGVMKFTVEPETERIKDGVAYDMRADTHPSVVYVNYSSIVPETSEYLQSRVKIEISCLSMDEPVQQKTLRSFISESVPESKDFAVDFKTVVPTRTFLEKIFLLHEEFLKEKPRSYRMSRHLYDLERIMDMPFGIEALSNRQLYMEIVQHRNTFNHIPGVDYTTHSPETINCIPPENVWQDWKDDYENMRKHFIYGHDTLPYDKLIDKIEELQNRIRRI